MAVVTHLILLVRHRVFAFTRLMAVAPTLALALILGHLVPPYSVLVCLVAERPPLARAHATRRGSPRRPGSEGRVDQGRQLLSPVRRPALRLGQLLAALHRHRERRDGERADDDRSRENLHQQTSYPTELRRKPRSEFRRAGTDARSGTGDGAEPAMRVATSAGSSTLEPWMTSRTSGPSNAG